MLSGSPSGTTTSNCRQPGSSRTEARAFSLMSRRKRSDVPGLNLNSTSTTYPPIGISFYFPIGLCDLFHMAAHDFLGAVRIARGNGVEHGAMRLIGDFVLTGALQRDVALLGQPCGDGLVDRRINRIARNDREHIVESHIRPFEGRDVVNRRAVCLKGRAKLIQ